MQTSHIPTFTVCSLLTSHITSLVSLSQLMYQNYYLFFFCLFRAAPTAHGNSQAGGQMGAVAAGLRHSYSNAGSFNSLCWARDRTCVLVCRNAAKVAQQDLLST